MSRSKFELVPGPGRDHRVRRRSNKEASSGVFLSITSDTPPSLPCPLAPRPEQKRSKLSLSSRADATSFFLLATTERLAPEEQSSFSFRGKARIKRAGLSKSGSFANEVRINKVKWLSAPRFETLWLRGRPRMVHKKGGRIRIYGQPALDLLGWVAGLAPLVASVPETDVLRYPTPNPVSPTPLLVVPLPIAGNPRSGRP
ncbi:hypothetical protein H5410_036435 [Solanum commersonii]|uniref:Uncharacterized protein n=1 Tax=Solanum commersonii TaxID=4109 RepID=A0A9J5Y3J1_SOLCO|nr:hypothetical protein H5410_036435 [Solanum commersonii]